MNRETIPLTGTSTDNNFYSGNEPSSGGESGTRGVTKRILHGLTIISVLIAAGTSVYGIFEADTPLIILPFIVVVLWGIIHLFLILFLRREKHDFHPPGWFIFVSSGNIFIQSLIVIILTLFKRAT